MVNVVPVREIAVAEEQINLDAGLPGRFERLQVGFVDFEKLRMKLEPEFEQVAHNEQLHRAVRRGFGKLLQEIAEALGARRFRAVEMQIGDEVTQRRRVLSGVRRGKRLNFHRHANKNEKPLRASVFFVPQSQCRGQFTFLLLLAELAAFAAFAASASSFLYLSASSRSACASLATPVVSQVFIS